MEITTKFSNGDVVHSIGQAKTKVWIPCVACNGGMISLLDNTDASCPRCMGRGGEYKYGDEEWTYGEQLTVGRVGVEITNSPGREGEEIFDNYKAQTERKEEYMCVETGVGSGTLHRVESLFPTKAEALDACIELNAQLEAPNDTK